MVRYDSVRVAMVKGGIRIAFMFGGLKMGVLDTHQGQAQSFMKGESSVLIAGLDGRYPLSL